MSMRQGEWWDDDAPYGMNGYTHRTGETVKGARVLREVTFEMGPRDPNCVLRGVTEMTDGRVYLFTILRSDNARTRDGRERVRFAHLSRQSFGRTAHGLLNWEKDGGRVSEDDAMRYRQEIDAA